MKIIKQISSKITLLHLLFPVAIAIFILNLLFRSQNIIILELLTVVVLSYVSLSLIHHHQDKSLTLETFLEYILIGALVLVLLAGQVVK